ncbi:tRNA N(3)-methylcytidine methyltransferase METTL2-like isoform X2 [Hemicordylus capensis]|uniref:tRNA N(3)-methylcytidine methyltransferase METTL2-like isoform X2 n=1 Tax=Hemicordylus capensis TaxID=884348 RepID=UPI0023046514|nr:tRNA N(3)-methylcytidine methyltransferase METTL2-like isoform X2 [Hemicordylus capensis]
MAAPTGDGRKRKQFGNRFLTDPARLFQHNAWDNVEWSEEQEAAARAKVQENSIHFVSQEQQDAYELNANKYWNDFYKTHDNGFFKDRHWLFTEFPELAPNQNVNQIDKSTSEDSDIVRNAKNSGPGGCCGNGLGSMETGVSEHLLDSETSSFDTVHQLHKEEEMALQKLAELQLSDRDFPGSSATYRILEVGCGAGNTVFPILQTNNDPGLFVYCCDFCTTAVDLVQTHPEYDQSRCFAFIHDLCENQTPFPMPDESLDVVVLIFVLSALLPEKMQGVISRLSRLLKPGGMILLRDYGRYDLAQLRFKKDELDSLFTTAGLEKVQNLVDRRLQVNRGKQVTMYRVWIQCKYRKPHRPRGDVEPL